MCKICGICHFFFGNSDFLNSPFPSLLPLLCWFSLSLSFFLIWVRLKSWAPEGLCLILDPLWPEPISLVEVSQAAFGSQLRNYRVDGWRVQKVICISSHFTEMKESVAQSRDVKGWVSGRVSVRAGLRVQMSWDPASFLSCHPTRFRSLPVLNKIWVNEEIQGFCKVKLWRKILCWLGAGSEWKSINQKRFLFVAVFGCVCTQGWYRYCRRSFNPFIQIYKKCCFLLVKKKKSPREHLIWGTKSLENVSGSPRQFGA